MLYVQDMVDVCLHDIDKLQYFLVLCIPISIYPIIPACALDYGGAERADFLIAEGSICNDRVKYICLAVPKANQPKHVLHHHCPGVKLIRVKFLVLDI